MKIPFGWITGGVAAFAVALVATLPATQVLPRAASLLEARGIRVAASGIDGSVWSGRVVSASVNGIALGASEWSLSPWSLLLGQAGLDFRLSPEGGSLAGSARLGTDALTVSGMDGQLPANALLSAAPPLPMPVTVDGTVMLHIETLDWNDGRVDAAEGTVLWRQAAIVSPMPVRLGDLRVELAPGADGALAGKLSDGGGPLGITGEVTLTKGSYRVDATLTARSDADPALAQSLPMLGRPDGKGGYRVTLNGRL
jgi:general secretion pathway protein N